MNAVRIEEVTVPDSLDGPDAAPFLALVQVSNSVELGVLGSDLITPSAAEVVGQYRDNPTRHRSHLVAVEGDEVIGRALITTRPHTPGAGAHLNVEVLPERRRRGVGTVLLLAAENAAADRGETTWKVSVTHTATPGGERLPAPTGFGDLPRSDPGVAFLLRHGYALEQVVRISELRTRGLAERVDDVPAPPPEYALHGWTGSTPQRWRGDLAHLRTRMSVDAPMAGLQALLDPWDEARIVEHDDRLGDAVVLTAAAEHRPTGRLAGFTEVVAFPDRPTVATQEDTLVLREHRGHGLGLALKAATARRVLADLPAVEAVVTWNAEENRPMLDVNERLGFTAIGLEGGWQKTSAGRA